MLKFLTVSGKINMGQALASDLDTAVVAFPPYSAPPNLVFHCPLWTAIEQVATTAVSLAMFATVLNHWQQFFHMVTFNPSQLSSQLPIPLCPTPSLSFFTAR